MTAHITVIVWGKPHVVTVYQKSKSEWIVAGQYKNKQFQVTDSGYNAAIKRWREAATDRGKWTWIAAALFFDHFSISSSRC
jgi:hypothetical protein